MHVHIIAIALLLQTDIRYSVGIWAYTICGAFLVNALIGKHSQLTVAALLLAAGIGVMPLLPGIQPHMLTIGLLFMLKVLFGFAVDHYGIMAKKNGEGESGGA